MHGEQLNQQWGVLKLRNGNQYIIMEAAGHSVNSWTDGEMAGPTDLWSSSPWDHLKYIHFTIFVF